MHLLEKPGIWFSTRRLVNLEFFSFYNFLFLVILFDLSSSRYIHSGGAIFVQQTAFTTQKDFGREAREAAWAHEQRTLHGLQTAETRRFTEKHTFRDINLMAEEAKRRAEIARSVMFSQQIPLHTHAHP